MTFEQSILLVMAIFVAAAMLSFLAFMSIKAITELTKYRTEKQNLKTAQDDWRRKNDNWDIQDRVQLINEEEARARHDAALKADKA